MEGFIFIVVIVIIIVILVSKSSAPEKDNKIKQVTTKYDFSNIEEKLKKAKKINDDWSRINNPILKMNESGISLEKQNKVKDAIAIYVKNINYIEKNYDKLTHIAIHSFERLMILYHKLKRFEDEKQIILKGLSMEAKLNSRTIDKWKTRLNKINKSQTKIISIDRSKIIIPHSKDTSLGQQFEKIEKSFPKFNFYENDKDLAISWEFSQKLQKHINFSEYHRIRMKFLKTEEQGLLLESQNKFVEAINLYEDMIIKNSPRQKTYDRLIILYRKFKFIEDEIRVLKQAIHFFTLKRKKMKENVLNIANTNDKLLIANEYIDNQKRLQYYNGMFDLYNPYKILDKWNRRLLKLDNKST